MADLINEFFERELNEVEAESLGKLIQQSPDEALRFEGLLESHYLATGLPSPQLPSALQNLPLTPGGWGSAAGFKLLLFAAAAGLGFLAWKFWPSPMAVPSSQAPTALSSAPPLSAAPAVALPHPSQAAKLLPVEPQETGPMAEGEELSVVVGTQEKTLVTVRVLAKGGLEIRDLYTGFIQPGHWSFRWDGDLFNGAPAPAGDYQIDVQTGALHQTKDIRIKAN